MIAAWMLYSVGVGLLLSLAALAGERAARLLRLPTRGVWVSALLAASFLSLLALLRGLTTAPGTPLSLPASAGAASASQPVAEGLVSQLTGAAAALRGAVAAVVTTGYATAAELAGGSALLLAGWALGSVLLLGVGGGTLLRLRRERHGWRELEVGGVGVLVSRDFGPAVVGVLRPAIVVPPWLFERPAEWQRLVVQHEDEHRRAGDPLLLCASCLAVGLLPWNVALWWLLRRVRLAVELDCDARLLRRGAAPLSYGSLLLDIAGHSRAGHLLTPAITGSRVHLERRLLAMSAKSTSPRRASAALAALVMLALTLVACGTDVPTAADVAIMDAADAQQRAEEAGLLQAGTPGDKTPMFMLDGRPVSEAEIKALAPDQIASIEVFKGEAAVRTYGTRGERGVISILSKTAAARAGKPRQPGPEGSAAADALMLSKERQPQWRITADSMVVSGDSSAFRGPVRVYVRELAPGADSASSAGTMLRRRRPDGIDTVISVRAGAAEADTTYRIGPAARPLIVIDGRVVPHDELDKLPPQDIESIQVLKNEMATTRYGERGRNGVILITRKPAARS